jgi:RimJ/RimL family protein N-acetyltransferase
MYSLTTARLRLRPLELGDAPFILELLNEDDFIRYIADRGVRDLAGAEGYLRDGPLRMYTDHGVGLMHASRCEDGVAVGFCGLLVRDHLEYPDLGFAFLKAFRGQGYATEAGRALVEHGERELGHRTLLAITHPDNAASIAVLGKLGFRFDRMEDQPGGAVRLFSRSASVS